MSSSEMEQEASAGKLDTTDKSVDQAVNVPEVSSSTDEALRLKHLKRSVKKVVERCMKSGARSGLFAKSYPCVVEQGQPRAVIDIAHQFRGTITSNFEKEFQSILENQNLPDLFSKLDKVIEEAPRQENSWRPSRDPTEDTVNHQVQPLLEVRQQLESQLSQLTDENNRLKETFYAQRQKIDDIKKTIDEKMSKIEEVSKPLMPEEHIQQALFKQ